MIEVAPRSANCRGRDQLTCDELMTEEYKAPPTGDCLQPGDIWRHQGMGLLYVTDEDRDAHPGCWKCYWGMGGNANAPWTFMNPGTTDGLTLVARWGEQSENGEWRLTPTSQED
jgi:hypothetical protein